MPSGHNVVSIRCASHSPKNYPEPARRKRLGCRYVRNDHPAVLFALAHPSYKLQAWAGSNLFDVVLCCVLCCLFSVWPWDECFTLLWKNATRPSRVSSLNKYKHLDTRCCATVSLVGIFFFQEESGRGEKRENVFKIFDFERGPELSTFLFSGQRYVSCCLLQQHQDQLQTKVTLPPPVHVSTATQHPPTNLSTRSLLILVVFQSALTPADTSAIPERPASKYLAGEVRLRASTPETSVSLAYSTPHASDKRECFFETLKEVICNGRNRVRTLDRFYRL